MRMTLFRSAAPVFTHVVAALSLTACGERTYSQPSDTSGRSAAAKQPVIDAQELRSPCEWLTAEELSTHLGPPSGEPYRVNDAESARPDATGPACAYPLRIEQGEVHLAVQVDPRGAPEFSAGSDMMASVVANELLALDNELGLPANGPAPEEDKPPRWDDEFGFPGERVYRVGHIAIRFGDRSRTLRMDRLEPLAEVIRGKMADKPFLNPERSDRMWEGARDPCQLLSRAEVEAVVGPLSSDQYRSAEASALADGNGVSCAYLAQGHRALVITPTWVDGKESFAMVGGTGKLLRSRLGGADEGDLLDGPWDQATLGLDAAVHFLAKDRMIGFTYRTSSADLEGVAKLATTAIPRLVSAQ